MDLVFIDNNRPVTDSLMVAEAFGKRHDNVMRDIRNILAEVDAEWGVLNFEETPYTNQQNGQMHKKFLMTEDGFSILVMGYTGKAAMEFKVKYISEFRRMQEHLKQLTSPSYMIADPIRRAERWIEEQKAKQALETEKLMLEQRVAEYEPKVMYVDQILQSTSAVTVTQIAKDYGLTAQDLNKILHEQGVQYKQSGQWLLYREYQSCGYTKSRTVSYTRSNGSLGSKIDTLWTQKGRLFIHEILTRLGYIPTIEKTAVLV